MVTAKNRKNNFIAGLITNIISNIIWIGLALLYGLFLYFVKIYKGNSLAISVLIISLFLSSILFIILKFIINVRFDRPFKFQKIYLYFKGYRLCSLNHNEIFRRYPCDKFVGNNKLPHIEIFVNNEELPMESFISRIDGNSEFRPKIDDSIGEDILRFNQTKVVHYETLRLKDLRFDNKKKEVKLFFEKTDYRSYLISNLFIDTLIPAYNQTVRSRLENYSKNGKFIGSNFASHAGVTVLLLSADAKIILLRNKKTSQTYPGMICGSTSGTIEYIDYKKGGICIPFEAIYREIDEELHLKPNDIYELNLLAITRDMTRGGIPEFIFFAKTNCAEIDLCNKFMQHYKDSWSADMQEIEAIENKGFMAINWDELSFEKSLSNGDFSLSALTAIFYYEKLEKTKLYRYFENH